MELLWCVFAGKVIIHVLLTYTCMGILVRPPVTEHIDWIKCLGNFWMTDTCIDFLDPSSPYESCFQQHISFNQCILHNDKNEVIKLISWIKRVVSYSGDHLGLWASYLIFGSIVQTHIMNIMCNQQTRIPVIRYQFTWKPNWAHIWRLKKNSQINMHLLRINE